MKKIFLLFLILLAVSLAGCKPQEGTASIPTSTATTEARPAPTVVLTVPTQSAFLPDSGCTVVTKKPTPGPTAESIYPSVSDTDHVKGPASAKVTIIEYSDFQ
jgi:protein-disulfide isomerase